MLKRVRRCRRERKAKKKVRNSRGRTNRPNRRKRRRRHAARTRALSATRSGPRCLGSDGEEMHPSKTKQNRALHKSRTNVRQTMQHETTQVRAVGWKGWRFSWLPRSQPRRLRVGTRDSSCCCLVGSRESYMLTASTYRRNAHQAENRESRGRRRTRRRLLRSRASQRSSKRRRSGQRCRPRRQLRRELPMKW